MNTIGIKNRRALIARFKRAVRGARYEYIYKVGRSEDAQGNRYRHNIWRVTLSDGRSTPWTTDDDLIRDGLGLNEGRGYMANKLAFGVGKLIDAELMLLDFGPFLVRARLTLHERLRLIEGGRRRV